VLTASRRSFRQLLLSCCGRRDDAESDTSAAYTATASAAATVEIESCNPAAIQPVDRMYIRRSNTLSSSSSYSHKTVSCQTDNFAINV